MLKKLLILIIGILLVALTLFFLYPEKIEVFIKNIDVVETFEKQEDMEEILETEEEQVDVEEIVEDNTMYGYKMPSATKPSTVGTISATYFENLFLYMITNNIYTMETSLDIGFSKLEDSGYEDVIETAFFDTIAYYHAIGSFYDNISYKSSGNEKGVTIEITVGNSNFTNSQITAYKTSFLTNITSILEEMYSSGTVEETDSDYEKARYYYQWCAVNLQYDLELEPMSFHGYGALVNKKAVCQGYVSVYNALCNASNIPSYGVVTSTGDHIYLKVKLNDAWLNVDPTFGDPTPDSEGYCDFEYFAY